MATPEEQTGDGATRGRAPRRRERPPPGELGRLGRILLEHAQGYALIGLDPEGVITSWSSGAERVLGWSDDEAVGRPADLFFTPESIERCALDRELRLARERGRADDELWHVRKGGERFWGSGIVTALRDERGRLVGYVKIVRDLTDRKIADEKLRASEERLRLALEAGRMGTWDWDVASGRVVWSETLERLHGLEPGTFPGTFEAFLADVHPEDRAYLREAVERTVRERRPDYEASYRIVRSDGEVRRLLARGLLLLDDRGRPVRMIGVCTDETERREAEIVRARLAAIVDSSTDAIIGKTLDGAITSWNRGAERIYGYTAEEAVGRPISIIVPSDRRAELADIMDRLRRGERVEPLETVRLTKDGRRLDISLTVSPVRAPDGRLAGASAIGRDVTARRRAERRARFLAEASRILASSLEYETTLQRVAELAVPEVADGCAIHVVEDGEARPLAVAHVDPAKAALARELHERYPPDSDAPLGVPHVLRTGEPELFRTIPPELIQRIARDREHLRMLRDLDLRSAMNVPLRARGHTVGALTLIAAESGRRYDADDLGFAEALADRVALAIENAVLFRETERRAHEEIALRRAAEAVTARYTIDEVLHQIAASALEATDAGGAFFERLDIDLDELEVAAVAGAETPPLHARIDYAGSLAERVIERGEPMLVSRLAEATHALSPALEAFPDASAIVLPLLDAGEAIGALFLLRKRGLTPFREDDLARAATFGRLVSLAFRKVRLLSESERRRDEIERMVESRARLIRGFSHDVKNPLGAADGHLELLETGAMEPLRSKQLDSVRRARASIHSSLALIDDLVELARAQTGRFEIQRSPVDVRDLAADVADEYRADAESAGLTLALELREAIPLISSDPLRIRQILGNLLSNAIKYTPGGGRIELSVATRSRGAGAERGRWIAIHVADTGPGIPADRHETIFEEFTRLDREPGKGAGLGLAISRSLARLLGGDVTVESEVGIGSTFTLWLPVDTGAGNLPPDAARQPRRDSTTPASRESSGGRSRPHDHRADHPPERNDPRNVGDYARRAEADRTSRVGRRRTAPGRPPPRTRHRNRSEHAE